MIEQEKIIESINISDWEIETDTGWESINAIHKTIPFKVFELKTETHSIKCADNHVIFKEDYTGTFVQFLNIDDLIWTDTGLEKVLSVTEFDYEENMYDLELSSESKNHRHYVNGILSHNSTTYCIYVLWLLMFHKDKRVLICANKEKVALEFIDRIKFAFELMPYWLKPGVDEWNKSRIAFSNNSAVEGMATSGDTGRSKSCNVLILDEFAFVRAEIAEKMWNSVYPIVSNALGSKVIMVSTPNGTGNIFYETYHKASMGISDDGWKHFRIDWHEYPGHDETWKRKQIASLNGDLRAWNQEFGNVFLGSSMTLINAELMQSHERKAMFYDAAQIIKLGKQDGLELSMWKPPVKGRVYVAGVDVGEGVGGDSSVVTVFDVTEFRRAEEVAKFASNVVSTDAFAFAIKEIGNMYYRCPLAIECNSIGKSIIDLLWNVYEYDNLVNHGTKNDPNKLGIYSQNSIKSRACMWLKEFLEDKDAQIILRDKYLICELESFERKTGFVTLFRAAGNKHDDRVMSLVWTIFALHPDNVENYFIVEKFAKNSFGNQIPEKLASFNSEFYQETDNSSKWGEDYGKYATSQDLTEITPKGLPGDEAVDDNTPLNLGFFN